MGGGGGSRGPRSGGCGAGGLHWVWGMWDRGSPWPQFWGCGAGGCGAGGCGAGAPRDLSSGGFGAGGLHWDWGMWGSHGPMLGDVGLEDVGLGFPIGTGGCRAGGPHGPSPGGPFWVCGMWDQGTHCPVLGAVGPGVVGLGVRFGSGQCGAGGLHWDRGMWGRGSRTAPFWGLWIWASPCLRSGGPRCPIVRDVGLGVPWGSPSPPNPSPQQHQLGAL